MTSLTTSKPKQAHSSRRQVFRRVLVVGISLAGLFACGSNGDSDGEDSSSDSASSGGAAATCSADQNECSTGCADLLADATNCGSCGNACGTTEVCSNGSCQDGCDAQFTQCGASCVDPDSSAAHCGTCDNACSSNVCTSGVCEASAAGGGSAGAGGSLDGGGASSSGGESADGSESAGGSDGASGGDSASGGSLQMGTLGINNLQIVENPNMTISAIVTWQTDEAASSEVQFGESDYQLRISDDELVTDHRVVVIGMHADTAYMVKATSATAADSGSAESNHTTGSLPPEVPLATLSVNTSERSQSGWTLTNILVGRPEGFGSTEPPIAVIYDEEAIPVWYAVHGTSADTRGDISTEYFANGTILVGPGSGESPREYDLEGNIVWTGPPNTGGGLMTHHIGKLASGNYILLRDDPNGGAVVEEITPDLTVLSTWSLLDHVDKPADAVSDWCHANSVTVNEDANTLYVNCRWQGLFKVDRSTGDVLWHMGAGNENPEGGDVTFEVPSSRFNDSHDPEIHDDGTIMFYDNQGLANRAGNGNDHSRVLEFQVDEANKSAQVIWEYPGDFTGLDTWYTDTWHSPYWGDADRLENGNILVTASNLSATSAARIFELVREDGEVVWEMILPNNYGCYSAQRISPPPLVQPVE